MPSACGEESAENHEILVKDTLLDIEVVLRYSVFYKEDVITKNIVVINHGIEPVYLEKGLTATLDFVDGEYDFILFRSGAARIVTTISFFYPAACMSWKI